MRLVLMIPLLGVMAAAQPQQPLRLHPDNPHYFLFRGKPVFLLTSAEHYGAVMNGAFDYKKYLATLAKDGLNYTRIFSGVYREVPGSFEIAANTLAPKDADYVTPWLRLPSGKWDLSRWNPAYFTRLKDFLTEAGRHGIVVEVTLFCPFYAEKLWEISPMNARNNVNNAGNVTRFEAMTSKDAALVKFQEELAKKLAAELAGFDNFFFEICNEPYFGGVSNEWQARIAAVIHESEADAGRHLIAQNIANHSASVDKPDPHVSILNFHYARPPLAVGVNWLANRVIGLDETGFDGNDDATYRMQAWDFLLAGGGLYNNLDYSFAVGREDGTHVVSATDPGGGSARLRSQLGHLKRFLEGFDFVRMSPDNGLVQGVPEGASMTVRAGPRRELAVYLHHGKLLAHTRPAWVTDTREHEARLKVRLAAGDWRAEWWDPKSGKVMREDLIGHPGGEVTLVSPRYREDLALAIRPRF